MSGMFALWIVLGSPLRLLHHELLSFHMVDHVLLMAVAPPLILLGAPFRSFAQALTPRFVRKPSAVFLSWSSKWSLVQQLGRLLRNPIFCWLVAVLALIGWHIPAAFELAMHSDAWHQFEYASFCGAGLLFWWPVIQPSPNVTWSPRWSTVLYLFFATFPCDMLSAFLTFCDRVVYPCYLSPNRHFSISPLQDQEYAGALMWVCVTFIYLFPAVIVTTQLLSNSRSHAPNLGRGELPPVIARPLAQPGVEVIRHRSKLVPQKSVQHFDRPSKSGPPCPRRLPPEFHFGANPFRWRHNRSSFKYASVEMRVLYYTVTRSGKKERTS
jgi:cytochrome c oxidase assembly factor CtaG